MVVKNGFSKKISRSSEIVEDECSRGRIRQKLGGGFCSICVRFGSFVIFMDVILLVSSSPFI